MLPKKKVLREIARNKLLEGTINFSTYLKLMRKIENLQEIGLNQPINADDFLTHAMPTAVTGAQLAVNGAVTAAGTGTGLFALLRILQAQRDNCVRACGEFSMFGGPKRDLCLAKCRAQVTRGEIDKIQNMLSQCGNNPQCVQMLQQRLADANNRYAQEQNNVLKWDSLLKRAGFDTKKVQVNPNSKHLFFKANRGGK